MSSSSSEGSVSPSNSRNNFNCAYEGVELVSGLIRRVNCMNMFSRTVNMARVARPPTRAELHDGWNRTSTKARKMLTLLRSRARIEKDQEEFCSCSDAKTPTFDDTSSITPSITSYSYSSDMSDMSLAASVFEPPPPRVPGPIAAVAGPAVLRPPLAIVPGIPGPQNLNNFRRSQDASDAMDEKSQADARCTRCNRRRRLVVTKFSAIVTTLELPTEPNSVDSVSKNSQ